ncbi:GNAT family N-acetyltransferase [Streptomyces sp. NRRL S-337]|uniref:GNAT family N-acetyltransferase n=1 Tax=Streptomyces sp. NRRL S-337 TaxID=1463900 RepID=UPI00068E71DA|nr:GNAT family N-acetyltransferase [Streptomyces sp. NRRL S-337]
MTPTLRTARLLFRPYGPEDENVFVELLSDEVVCRWMGQERCSEAEIRTVYRSILTDVYGKNLFDVWGVWRDGDYVGHAEIKKTGNVDGHEAIVALVRKHWGQGLGGELVQGLLTYAADTLGLKEVYGMVGAENTASLALSERLGFRHVRDVVSDTGGVTKMLVVSTVKDTPASSGSTHRHR